MTTPAQRYGLGRKVEHDPRSRRYAVPPAQVTIPAYSWTWRRRAPILDQGNLGACTGFAMAGWLGTDTRSRSGRVNVTNEEGRSLYSEATRLDQWDGEWPPEDTGSSGLAVAKAAQGRGLIREYRHAFSMDQVIVAMLDGPVMVGCPWYESMYTPDGQGYVRIAGDVVGGHEWLVRGYDPRRRHFLCDNSWSVYWGGHNGRFWIRQDDLGRLLDESGDCTVPIR